MKTIVNGLLKGRITRWGFLAVLLIAAGATVAGMKERQYQLGGSFIGNNGAGNIWSGLNIPHDPAGRSAAVRVNLTTYNADTAGLLAAFGADSLSEFVGEEQMTSRDTAKYGTVAYAYEQGNPPQRRAIFVMNGTLTFTGPDSYTVDYAIEVYPASTDADLDGYPDAGAIAVVTIPGVDHAKRVPIP
jgi:hypothetical protein